MDAWYVTLALALAVLGDRDMPHALNLKRVAALGFLVAPFVILACQAQSLNIEAQSPDARVQVSITRATIHDAFAEMCGASIPLPCDDLEEYEVHIRLNRNSVGLEYFHDDVGRVHLGDFRVLPAFGCSYDEAGPRCSAGGDEGLVVTQP